MKDLKQLLKKVNPFNEKEIKKIVSGKSKFPFVLFVLLANGDTVNIHFVKNARATNRGYSEDFIQQVFPIEEVKKAILEIRG